MSDKCFMILGGGGMIGFEIAHRICRYLEPEKVVIVSLYQQEVREAVEALGKEFPGVTFTGFWGDIFIRSDFNTSNRQERQGRGELLQNPEQRADLYNDLFGPAEDAYQASQLVQLIHEHRPDVIVDAINTATAISYQDIYTASKIVRRDLDAYLDAVESGQAGPESREKMVQAVETLLISQYIPQLVRHVVMINQAMREAKTRLYLKIGTTGTGGMGLNIPYTHGEDKPSAKLMSKTAVAFAHTGLMFLMARTPGGPIVKELKPAAMVGWVDITLRAIRRHGKNAQLFVSQPETLGASLDLRLPESQFTAHDRLKLVVADTGENGVFAKGEFEAITALRQMEFITPEEIARAAVLEIQGINTGKDVIPALDSSIMGPTYRGGFLRRQAIDDLNRLEEETQTPSVALGELGPPELSKLLWEAYLLKQLYGTLGKVLEYGEDAPAGSAPGKIRPPTEISAAIQAYLAAHPEVSSLVTSIGVPILMPDGRTLLRGPFIRIPEISERSAVKIEPGSLDQWARKGWVDLRPENMAAWQKRLKTMRQARQKLRGRGSAAVDREAYMFNKIFIGEVVGWVMNNEMGGYRIK